MCKSISWSDRNCNGQAFRKSASLQDHTLWYSFISISEYVYIEHRGSRQPHLLPVLMYLFPQSKQHALGASKASSYQTSANSVISKQSSIQTMYFQTKPSHPTLHQCKLFTKQSGVIMSPPFAAALRGATSAFLGGGGPSGRVWGPAGIPLIGPSHFWSWPCFT